MGALTEVPWPEYPYPWIHGEPRGPSNRRPDQFFQYVFHGDGTQDRALVAGGIHGQLKDRALDNPLFPLITARGGEQLHLRRQP